MEERGNLSDHSLKLRDRRIGTVTGVQDIKSFDDKEILLFTKAGKLLIKGDQLHVKRLNLEKGEIDLEVRVDNLFYLSKNADNRQKPLLRRLFH